MAHSSTSTAAELLSPLPLLFERGVNARVRLHYTGVPGACPMDM